jgi:hypothetical protein
MSRFILQKRFKKRLGVGRYALRSDMDNASRMGNIKKHTHRGDYFPPCCNGGGNSGHNFMFHSPYKVATPIRAVAKPHSLYYPRENIGVKNFKKVENVCNHK